jgi:hypothetical protein
MVAADSMLKARLNAIVFHHLISRLVAKWRDNRTISFFAYCGYSFV